MPNLKKKPQQESFYARIKFFLNPLANRPLQPKWLKNRFTSFFLKAALTSITLIALSAFLPTANGLLLFCGIAAGIVAGATQLANSKTLLLKNWILDLPNAIGSRILFRFISKPNQETKKYYAQAKNSYSDTEKSYQEAGSSFNQVSQIYSQSTKAFNETEEDYRKCEDLYSTIEKSNKQVDGTYQEAIGAYNKANVTQQENADCYRDIRQQHIENTEILAQAQGIYPANVATYQHTVELCEQTVATLQQVENRQAQTDGTSSRILEKIRQLQEARQQHESLSSQRELSAKELEDNLIAAASPLQPKILKNPSSEQPIFSGDSKIPQAPANPGVNTIARRM